MPTRSSIQQTLQGLADELAAAYPTSARGDVAPSPFPSVPPPTRAAFRARIAEARDAVERFRPVWSGNSSSTTTAASVDDDIRVKASGSMREWATNTALLAGLPSLARLPNGPGTLAPKTPFALPPGMSVPSLLEARARRLGLEVYRETLLDADDEPTSAAAAGAREVLVLGGKALVVELELASTVPSSEGYPVEASQAEESGLVRWTLVKSSTSISIPGAAEPLAVPTLDGHLRPPLERLLALASLSAASKSATGLRETDCETPELVMARELALWEAHLAAALASEAVFAGRPAVFDEAASLAALLGSPSTGAGSVDELFPSLKLGKTTLRLEPIPRPSAAATEDSVGSAGPSTARLASRLPFLAPSPSGDAPAIPTDPFFWEATFTPPLVVPVCSVSAAIYSNTPSTDAATQSSARLGTCGYWQPPGGRGRAQRWTLDHQAGGLDLVAFGRVGLASTAEAKALVEWSWGWIWAIDFAEKVLGGADRPSIAPVALTLDELTLESLSSQLSVASSAIPVTLSLPSSVACPSITLTVPHPSQPVAVQVLLSPLVATSGERTSAARIALRPAELEERVGRARLDALGEMLGGEGHAVVLWLMKRLAELEHEGDEPKADRDRHSKRMRVD